MCSEYSSVVCVCVYLYVNTVADMKVIQLVLTGQLASALYIDFALAPLNGSLLVLVLHFSSLTNHSKLNSHYTLFTSH